jgi:hypothetical protein
MGGVLSVFRLIILCSIFTAGVGGPAVAEDCFIKVRAGVTGPAPVPRAVSHHRAFPTGWTPHGRHTRHGAGAGLAKRRVIAAATATYPRNLAGSALEMRTTPAYVMRPTSCDAQPPARLQSPLPASRKPPGQKLLDAVAPIAGASEGAPPFAPPGGFIGPSGVVGGPGGVSGLAPPSIMPTDVFQPPVPAPGDSPGIVGSPGLPPVSPIGVSSPIPPAPIAALPEPAAWEMMILGFLAVGVALRSRREVTNRGESGRSGNTGA